MDEQRNLNPPVASTGADPRPDRVAPEAGEAGALTCHLPSGRRGKISPQLRRDLERRMNRIEGQVRGIKGMIDAGAYCDDILHQITAAQNALSAVARLILESHIRTCVIPRLKEDDPDILEEFLRTVRAMMRTGV
ncbi:metal-sensitive transcriptional regulator [Hydrogenibacillus schlegelii]|uniref:Metal-sensitive transcriptional regulator n=1 Tax=Hydrogenibacillus schlegelii TaxID=1484 RepID=A0A2T5GC99_HYDSH|nr:metal-sensitive transcriptional regulator [Hydrogenibacillus schlegelii]MBT9283370.1 metal-sensitive transcriptional regulator [Hydrogenibacillus schlegelii]PTQ53795.1 MAG: Repressor CsoR of the copZA operon [Hydrogenibacillus schlegelii]